MTTKKELKRKAEREQLRQLDLISEILKNQDLSKILDSDNEHNLDTAFSLGILFTLDNFKHSKRIPKRMLKSMSFLKNTTEIDNEIITELQNDMIDIDGKSRKEYMKTIQILCNSANNKQMIKNESRLSRFFNR